jgi:hypothetical protein
VGESNYGSRGASVNVELELDGSLVGDPAKLQERIRQMFGLVRSSLAEELNGNGHSHDEGGAKSNGNGQGNGKQAAPPRPATASQVKAIFAIAKDRGINVHPLIYSQYGTNKVEQLTVKQASELIDHLKSEGGGG